MQTIAKVAAHLQREHKKAQSPHGHLPRIVHHYWDHGVDDTGRPPNCTIGIMQRNAARNPSWVFSQKSRAETIQALKAVRAHVPNVTAAFRCIANEYPQARSDLLRWSLLYMEGGIYFDIDIEMLDPFERIFDAAFTDHLHVSAHAAGPRGISTGVLAAPPRHPAVRRVLDYLVNNVLDPFGAECAYGKRGCLVLTGPGALNRALAFKPTNQTYGFTDPKYGKVFVHDGRHFVRQVRYDAGNGICYRNSERRFNYALQTTPVLTPSCRSSLGNGSATREDALADRYPACRSGQGFGRGRGVSTAGGVQ